MVMRVSFVTPILRLGRLRLSPDVLGTMTPIRRSARLSGRMSTARMPDSPPWRDPTPRKRRRASANAGAQELAPKRNSPAPEEESKVKPDVTVLEESFDVTAPTFESSCNETASTPPTRETGDDYKPAKSPRRKKTKPPPPPIYPDDMQRPYGPDRKTMRIVTWNVASLRTILKTGALTSYLYREQPDFLCLQETKMTEEAMEAVDPFEGYVVHWNHSLRKGYSGVAVLVRENLSRLGITVERVERGCGEETADGEGRVLSLYMSNGMVLVNAYVPNSGAKLARLGYRTETFEPSMRSFLNQLAKENSVVYTGDLNVAHEVIDIHNSKGNQKSAGHTPEERAAFGEFLRSGEGWIDCWRKLYKEYSGYTYYSRRFGDRLKNDGKGWRLDYFVIDKKTMGNGVVCDLFVRPNVGGSDHYPLVLDYRVKD